MSWNGIEEMVKLHCATIMYKKEIRRRETNIGAFISTESHASNKIVIILGTKRKENEKKKYTFNSFHRFAQSKTKVFAFHVSFLSNKISIITLFSFFFNLFIRFVKDASFSFWIIIRTCFFTWFVCDCSATGLNKEKLKIIRSTVTMKRCSQTTEYIVKTSCNSKWPQPSDFRMNSLEEIWNNINIFWTSSLSVYSKRIAFLHGVLFRIYILIILL